MRRILTTLATTALILTACGGSDDVVTLRLLTHDSFDVSVDVLAAFTAESGIEVELIPLGDAGSALNRVILTAEDPDGDLLFGVDTTFLTRALDAGLFLPYRSSGLDRVDPSLQPSDDRVTPITAGDVCVNYDVAWFEASDLDVPTTFADLADPRYGGLLAVQNAATSSPGLAFLLASIEVFGEDGAFEFWQRLRANDVLVTDGWSDAYYGAFTHAGGGDRPLVVSYASSPPAEVLFADVPTDVAPTGVIEATCFRQVEYVGILATTAAPEAARLLVDFMLSRTFQEDLPLTMFVLPVVSDAVLPDVFVQHAVVPAAPIFMDPDRIDAGRETWIARFTTTVLR